MKKPIVLAGLAIALGVAYWLWPSPPHPITTGKRLVDVALPATFTANEVLGKNKFEAHCASCHGINAAGQEGVAPPLVHIIYEPNHHGDESFHRAAALGVRAHHWRFGDMPAIEAVTLEDVSQIIAYVRALQRANGIQ